MRHGSELAPLKTVKLVGVLPDGTRITLCVGVQPDQADRWAQELSVQLLPYEKVVIESEWPTPRSLPLQGPA